EAKLKASRWVSEAVMLGDRRPYCVALIVPNFANLEEHARANGWPMGSPRELLAVGAVRGLYEGVINELNVTAAPFATIKRFELLDRDLRAGAGELAPALKGRRRVVSQTFHELIEGMYDGAAAARVG